MSKRTIVILAVFPWDSELLHRSHALARAFSKLGHRVFYVYNHHLTDCRSKSDGIEIYGLGGLPYMRGRLGFIYDLNGFLFRKKLGRILAKFENPILYVMHPLWAKAIPAGVFVATDISDEHEKFAKNRTWESNTKKNMYQLINRSDKFVLTVASLGSNLPEDAKRLVVSNGVDIEQLTSAKPAIKSAKKIVGFIGGIYQWLDLNLIKAAAVSIPEALFILVGPTDRKAEVEKLTSIKNIDYIGPVPNGDIPGYYASLDVGLVPFVSELEYPRLRTVDSNKIYQYAACGTPIVATNFTQTEQLRGRIKVAKNDKEFIGFLKEALTEGKSKQLEDFARANSWTEKAEEIIKFLES